MTKKIAFLFPGQGSQAVGMLNAFKSNQFTASVYATAALEAEQALGQDLAALIEQGPAESLNLTTNTQPAMLMADVLVLRAWLAAGGAMPNLVAGHSLGEYAALVAAGVFSLSEGLGLVRIRAQAMQEAVPVGVGAMAALLGLDFETARTVAQEAAQGEVCQAANDNDPSQVVVSGHRSAVERALIIAKERGAKRAMLLPVSAPFHCVLMAPAADVMAIALERVDITMPDVPLVSNVSASAVTNPADIRSLLVSQVTGSVRWRESVSYMAAQGVTEIWEIGAGKALSGMIRRIDKSIVTHAVGAPDDIKVAAAALMAE